jgi:hypothetical protein
MLVVPLLALLPSAFAFSSSADTAQNKDLNEILAHIHKECTYNFQPSVCDSVLDQVPTYQELYSVSETCPRGEMEGAHMMSQRWTQTWGTLEKGAKPFAQDLFARFMNQPGKQMEIIEKVESSLDALKDGAYSRMRAPAGQSMDRRGRVSEE